MTTYYDDPSWLDRYGMEAEAIHRPGYFQDVELANYCAIRLGFAFDFGWIIYA